MNILVFCCGLYVDLANHLADKGKNTVWYYTPYGSMFPSWKEYAPGDKFEYLTKVKYPFDYVDKADMIVSFDCSNQDLINYLRNKYPDKSVFGAGLMSRIEDNRLNFKKILESAGLPVVPYKAIKGMTALREYLKSNPNKMVKADIFRGDFQSLKCENFEAAEQILKDREPALGNASESFDFIVEDILESKAEIGFDGFMVDGEAIPFSFGWECDKNFYLGKTGNDIPDVLRETLDALAPFYEKAKYRGSLSTEELITDKGHFFIDACQRVGMPLGTLYSKFINNWPELVYGIGRGEIPEVDTDVKYVGAFALPSRHAEKYFTKVNIEKGHREDFRFLSACMNDKKEYYAVAGCAEVVVIVAGGKSPEDVVKQIQEKSQYVSAFDLENEAVEGLDKLLEKIKQESKDCGIDF